MVYKCKHKADRYDLENLSKCLAIQTQAASMIADTMYEKSQAFSDRKQDDMGSPVQQDEQVLKSNFDSLQKRIRSMNGSKTNHGEFDGTIDDLI